MSKKSEPLITLVVRRGALRRFHKLKKETVDLPVVVTWDRRITEHRESTVEGEAAAPGEDRRKQQSFTWDLADFIVVPGEPAAGEAPEGDDTVTDTPERRRVR